MNILVVGVNGRVGSLVCKKAIEKGINVSGLGRDDNKNNLNCYLKKDAMDITLADLANYDVVVDAVGGWDEKNIPNITNVMKHLADLLVNSNKRLIVVGGAGSLFVNKERTITVDMGADFPNSWKPLSSAHGKGLSYLRTKENLNWTYISPACNFDADGIETGEYKLAGEDLALNSNGESVISYADYAIALVDVIISGKYNKERISVVSK